MLDDRENEYDYDSADDTSNYDEDDEKDTPSKYSRAKVRTIK